MFNLGNIVLVLALVMGISGLGCYIYAALRDPSWIVRARALTGAMVVCVVVASLFLWSLILTHQFRYSYVTNFTDRSLPTLLLFTTFWGGQAGSFLLWALWSAIFSVVLMLGLRSSPWERYVLPPYLAITLCITGITLATGPFAVLPADQAPTDGRGLNPLLQNYWMAIHPPILFTGFTTMAGPYAFAIAALWRREYDSWVALARPWTILAWSCMGTGLALGGFWAYESLGWGGFWGWDPVENSSLVPWLFASALLHGLIVQGARGSLKRSNIVLAIVGELMVIYSTFLTRSGVLANFSVHSFVELGLLNYLLAFIILFALLGFGMLMWRWREISRRIAFLHVLSREFGLVVCVLLFVVIALIVGFGTSMPVISMLPLFDNRFSLDLGWYGPTVAPLALLLVVTMAIGPLLGWQRHKYGSLFSMLRWPSIITAVVLFICVLLNVVYPVALLFLAAAIFAATTNAAMIRRIWRTGPLKLGGYLCHIGVGLLFVGVIGTTLYKQTAALQLVQDEPQRVFGQQFTFRGIVVPPDDPLQRTALQIEVANPATGTSWIAEAPYYIYDKTNQLVTHPDIQAGLWSDLYVAPSQYLPAPQRAPGLLQLEPGQPRSLLGYTVTFQEFDIPNREAMMRGEGPAEVFAVVDVQAPDGTRTTVRPAYRFVDGQTPQSDPVNVPGGANVALLGIDPSSQLIQLQFGGVDLRGIDPIDLKDRVFVEISDEPGIRLVWIGITIAICGGILAFLRRWWEGHPSDLVPAFSPLGVVPRQQMVQPASMTAITLPGSEMQR